jgi:hypothetical protein
MSTPATPPVNPTTAPLSILDVRSFANPAPKTIWVQYRDTAIELEVCFMSKARFKVLTERCSTIRYDEATRKHVPQIDTKKIAGAYVREAVSNWRGVTPKGLGSIIPVNLENLTPEQQESQIPFSIEQLVFLVETAFEMDTFIQEVTMNPLLFNQQTVSKEDAAKNSSSSPGGS